MVEKLEKASENLNITKSDVALAIENIDIDIVNAITNIIIEKAIIKA